MSADPDAPKKKGFLVPVLALALGGAGAVGATQLAPVQEMMGVAPAAEEGEPPIEYGEFTELNGIVVNPRGTDGRRYLMVKIGVEAEEAETLDRLGLLQPAAIDAVIDILGAQSVDQLADVTRRDSLKADIIDRFNAMLGEDGPVTRLYFTQYVLQ